MSDQEDSGFITCGHTHPDARTNEMFEELRANEGFETGPMGGCGRRMKWTFGYRCVECGRWFHRDCIKTHFALSGDDKKAAA